jgi:hypothetical protein
MPAYRRTVLAALAAASLLAAAPSLASARPDGEGEEPQTLEQKIMAQMEKVLRLMRENEKALLEATRGSGKKPTGVEFTPPVAPESGMAAPEAGMASPEAGMEAPPPSAPPSGGEEIRKRIDELLKISGEKGAQIPRELEELVKMIPIMGWGGGGQSEPKPDDGTEPQPREGRQPKPEDGGGKPETNQEPKDPARKPEERTGKPPEGEKGDETRPDVPPWAVNLPPEIVSRITSGDTESVPPQYRWVIEKYQKWLTENVKGRTR